MTFRVTLILVLLLAIISLPAMAQERGQYVPGTAGLNSGIQAPEGFTYANLFVWYPTTKFKDQNGDTSALNFDLDLVADFNLFAYTTKTKFSGRELRHGRRSADSEYSAFASEFGRGRQSDRYWRYLL
jgi:hypothetical protein